MRDRPWSVPLKNINSQITQVKMHRIIETEKVKSGYHYHIYNDAGEIASTVKVTAFSNLITVTVDEQSILSFQPSQEVEAKEIAMSGAYEDGSDDYIIYLNPGKNKIRLAVGNEEYGPIWSDYLTFDPSTDNIKLLTRNDEIIEKFTAKNN